MESEKVKEIKEALECCKQNEIEETCRYCLVCPASIWDYEKTCTSDLSQKTLTLINELESENERLSKSDTSKEESSIEYYNLYRDFKRENQKLKAENERLKEAIADQNELCWNCKKSVKEFAEKLKKRLNLGLYEWQYAEVDSKTIDELLKEYLDER